MIITFERAIPVDAVALTEVQTRTFDDDSRRFLGQPSGGPPGYDSVGWQVQRMQRGADYYKILADGQIVGGMIVFKPGPDTMVLGRIYVDPDFQDRGIGTQAMAWVEAQYPGAQTWRLDTPTWATRNHHFYEKLGYKRVRVVAAEENVEYEKRLT
jgi:GNAT superfamily N-acetyltransferase